jgi:hypothetical protein
VSKAKEDKLNIRIADGLAASNVTNDPMFRCAFMTKKAELLDKLEKVDTGSIEELQEAHRTYKNLLGLEDYFTKFITRGDVAANKLKSTKKDNVNE